ncbi:YchA-1 [Escherichia coli TA447]|uniref:YchA-1 n=1 Tax=Escherichia coli TA447 TaxID=656447 RepID=A0A1X3ITC0_ECOLX|nr:YchA-1 [Escherichia coli TA447]
MLCRFCCSDFRRRGHLRLPAAWRHPVVRPDSDRQLLAHPPVSAEPAGAVSGCRYGPMSEKPGLQRPFRSRRPCRAGNGAPCTPDGV